MLSSFDLWTGSCMVPSEDEEIVYTIGGPSDNISLLWIEWVSIHYCVSSCVDVYLFNMLVFPIQSDLQHVRPRVCSKVRTEIPRLRYIVKRKFDSAMPALHQRRTVRLLSIYLVQLPVDWRFGDHESRRVCWFRMLFFWMTRIFVVEN